MQIRAGYTISYDFPAPVSMILMLSIRPERVADLVTPQVMTITPSVPARHFSDVFGNLCTRLHAPPGRMTFSSDFIIQDDGQPDEVAVGAEQSPIEALPDEALMFLLGSRYCEVDRFHDLAWNLFGGVEPGWARAQAIVAYAHERITFGYQHARPTKTAFEAHEEGRGVCRDYAHLAVTLCRCMNIPARYCTGYLPDIGVPYNPDPMDFCAWIEVYLGGRWITLDARHNKPRIGRILMAYGRDATDVAIATTFGPNFLAGFEVTAEEVA